MYFARKAAVAGFILFFAVYLICPSAAEPLRFFDEIFPGMEESQKSKAFGEAGFKRPFERHESRSVIPGSDSGIDLFSVVMEKKPTHFIEALLVIPYEGEMLDLLDAYNAVGRIEDMKNHSYLSRNREMKIFVFEESTRIESARKNKPIPDPPPSMTIPASEEIFLYLKDRYFGNIYARGDLSTNRYGLTLKLTNFRTIRYFLFPVMRAEKLCAILYLEPLEEGMLVYGMAAVDIPDFIASRINISSSVERRLNVFIDWIKKGLRNT